MSVNLYRDEVSQKKIEAKIKQCYRSMDRRKFANVLVLGTIIWDRQIFFFNFFDFFTYFIPFIHFHVINIQFEAKCSNLI